MSALNKALSCLFVNANGYVPPESEVDAAVSKLFSALRTAGCEGDLPSPARKSIRWKDLYLYFQRNVEGGASSKAIDRLFNCLDVNGNGTVSESEFRTVVLGQYQSLRDEAALDERLARRTPHIHVVPGSTRLNCMSNTQAFKVQVVTKRWLRQLGQTWAELDFDKDGMVTEADMKRYFLRERPGLLPFLPGIYRAVDKPRAGKITFKQFLKALYPEASQADVKTLLAMSHAKLPQDNSAHADDKLLQEILNVFTVYDDDRSGTLDEDEFISAMDLTGHTEEESRGMFHRMDIDGSGTVTIDEFTRWYTSNYAAYMAEAQRRMLDERDSDDDDGGGG